MTNHKWQRRIHRALTIFNFVFLIFNLSAQPTNDIPPLSPTYSEIPPTYFEQHRTALSISGVLALVVLGAAVWLLTRPRKTAPVPPEVSARTALEVLRRRNEDGRVLSEVSQVLRRYLAAAFALPTGELTTTEFCAALNQNEKVGTELSTEIADFLQRCDDRKFKPAVAGAGVQASARPGESSAAVRALELVERGQARISQLSAVNGPKQ